MIFEIEAKRRCLSVSIAVWSTYVHCQNFSINIINFDEGQMNSAQLYGGTKKKMCFLKTDPYIHMKTDLVHKRCA